MNFGARPAIMVAMGEELAPFLDNCTQIGLPYELGGIETITAKLGANEVVLVRTGIGLVNAATGATLALSRFGATGLISAGSAGGMGDGVQVGDIVIGTEALFSTADATAFTDYQVGQIPNLPARFRSPAHGKLPKADLAEERVHQGLVISGDLFVWERNFQTMSRLFPDALAADMETAAIAQVAYRFEAPWLAVRGISDLCGPVAADDFIMHIDNAATLSAQVVIELLENGARAR